MTVTLICFPIWPFCCWPESWWIGQTSCRQQFCPDPGTKTTNVRQVPVYYNTRRTWDKYSKQTFFTFGLLACTCLKTVHEFFEIGKGIQASRIKHPVLVQQLVHDEVHKSDLLGERKIKTENSLINGTTAKFMQQRHAYIVTRKPLPVFKEVWELLQFVGQIFEVRLLLPILEGKEVKSPISSCTDINDSDDVFKQLLERDSQSRRSTTWQSHSWSPWTGSQGCPLGPSHPPSCHLRRHQTYCDTKTTRSTSGSKNMNQWGRFCLIH